MKIRELVALLVVGITIGAIATYFYLRPNDKNEKTEISHNLIVEKIERLGNLEVVKYNLQDVVEYQKVRQWLPNAKTALIIAGEVIACIDMTKIQPDDIYTQGDSIRLTLPSPEICHVKIDHSRSKVYNMEYGLWESEKIMDQAYKNAEQHLYSEALKLNIGEESRNNTIQLLEPLLQAMGFNKVYITFDSSKNNIEKRKP